MSTLPLDERIRWQVAANGLGLTAPNGQPWATFGSGAASGTVTQLPTQTLGVPWWLIVGGAAAVIGLAVLLRR
ncbi:MAG: hypothetical protein RLO01_01805 [Thalassobaculaceae bacterium]